MLKEQWEKKGHSFVVALSKSKMAGDLAFVKEKTEFLDEKKSQASFKYSNTERLWFLFNDVHEFPKCLECGKALDDPKSFLSLKDGFRTYCSLSCATSSKERTKHIKQTTLERTGYETNFSNPAVRKQIADTNASKTDEQKQMRIERARETRMERNDGKWHAEDFGQKCKKTKLERHGDPNWHNVELTKQHLLEDYGVTCAFNIPSVEEKSALAIKKRSYELTILKCEFDEPMFSLEFYCQNHAPEFQFEFKCKKCGTVFKSAHINGLHKRCPLCYPKVDGTSLEEQELVAFLKEHCDEEVLTNTRSIIFPLELDACIQKAHLAVEFDGLYWHSDAQQKDHLYHLKKTEACEAKGIQLVHVFEDEWLQRRSAVESQLKRMLGACEFTFFAEKCKTESVAMDDAVQFTEENSVFGSCVAHEHLGLKHNGMLVALASFLKGTSDGEWQLASFCCKNSCEVKGALHRLIEEFERMQQPRVISCNVDRRWSSGSELQETGFKLVGYTEPSFTLVAEVGVRKKLSEDAQKDGDLPKIYNCGEAIFIKQCSLESTI